jgi:SAM-dependent methyltransferase
MNITVQDERGYNQLFRAVGSSRYRSERRHEWFIAQAKRNKAIRILEIGCGTGAAAAAVALGTGAEVVGVDVSSVFLDQARATHRAKNVRFEKSDLLADDPSKLGNFDFVFGNGILHHLVPQLNHTLRVLRGITNKGGGMAFIEPNFMNPYCAFIFGTKMGRKWALLEPDEMAFRAGQLQDVVSEAGWRNVQVKTRDFLLPGMPVQLIKPVLAVESIFEATALTRWLAQSHFVTAENVDGVEEKRPKETI